MSISWWARRSVAEALLDVDGDHHAHPRPVATVPSSSFSGRSALTSAKDLAPLGSGTAAARLPTAAEHQQRVKEENRRAAAAAAAGGLLATAGEEGGRLARPVSGNKKFLAKYALDRMNLFAP